MKTQVKAKFKKGDVVVICNELEVKITKVEKKVVNEIQNFVYYFSDPKTNKTYSAFEQDIKLKENQK